MSRRESRIVAVVTLRRDLPAAGIPVFPASSDEERERLARLLARILQAAIHDLQDGTYAIVRH